MALPIALLALATGCTEDVDFFRSAGFAQESFTNNADLLFVIDNSCSMTEESAGLASNFSGFIDQLTDPEAGGQGNDGLSDAVSSYIEALRSREGYVDFRISITTTNVAQDYGGLKGSQPYIDNSDPNIPDAFRDSLLCETACLDPGVIPSDPSYTCGDPVTEVTSQYLDCQCGEGGWLNQCTTEEEEGIEAVFMAMCRAVENPPDECYADDSQFRDTDILSNEGMLRDDSVLIPIVISDEGDQSRRATDGDADISPYLDRFRRFDQRMAWAVIGPSSEFPDCPSGAANWGTQRYEDIVSETRGRYIPIKTEVNGTCTDTDFGENLEQLGELLSSLLEAFPLTGVPDEDSILAFVEGKRIDRAVLNEDETYGDGWSYDVKRNAVVFHGEALPDYEEKVEIYYLPLSGMPRELPF